MDWPSKIENVSGTLAYNLISVSNRLSGWKPPPKGSNDVRGPGVFTEQESARLSILNASYSSIASEHDAETVLVFPDFKAVVGAGATEEEAEALWRHSIDPALGPLGRPGGGVSSVLHSHILPYAAVVMICEFVASRGLLRHWLMPATKVHTNDETTVAG